MIATSNFLIPNATLIVEIIAFLIVLFVLRRYVLPPVNKALQDRQENIRTALEQAEAARAEADETRAQRQVIVDEARQQAREILAQANTTAERVRSESADRAQQEYERLVGSAQAEIALARQRAVDEVSGQVAALVVSVAQQVIGREVDAERHRALIDEAVAALRSSPAASPAGSEA
ncbi:MAG TPA: F0F1 ATP synthase subunit B [Acidimicrobiales bacterium]|nr:F0F1 ATP synthase subunit B [Acidimicrobiales bacterium]